MALPSYTQTYHTSSYPSISPTLPTLSNKGKVILITGGGSGVGPSIATSFFHSSLRAIALIGRTASTLLSTKNTLDSLPYQSEGQKRPEILTYTASVTDSSAIDHVFADLKDKFGGVDVLILNAAYFPIPTPIASASIQEWQEGFNTNVIGSVILTKAFLATLASGEKKPEGVIINVTTAATHIPAMEPPIAAYAASKIAGVKMMEYLAVECRGKGVRLLSIHPGVHDTEQGKIAGSVGLVMPFDELELPANFMVWAASPEAEFLHGKFVWANWDVDELKAKKEEIVSGMALTLGLNGWP